MFMLFLIYVYITLYNLYYCQAFVLLISVKVSDKPVLLKGPGRDVTTLL